MNQATTPRNCTCAECGVSFASVKASRFCSSAHRVAFQNRRVMRGAILYDLWMTNRHERGLAKTLKVLHRMTRLAMYWHEQDKGRKTWEDARKAVARTNWAEATVVFRKR